MTFIGEYTHTLDDKKRVALPSKFRKALGGTVVLTRGLDHCVFAYPIKEWKTIAAEIGAMGMAKSESRGFSRFMLSGAVEVDVDSSGRILVPEHLCAFGDLTVKVVFAGVYNRIELWNEKRWLEYQTNVVSNADAMAEKLGDIGAL